ncbi:MAG TPA: glycosyltransferase [Candidatus Saccharimonadales bacterium]|nr:glycosyltransferase [Candidatus Saccharimonadales bacterium]
MRIVIASDLHYPTINGVATFGRNLAQGLAEKGHEVIVIAPSQTGKKHHEVDKNYTIMRTASLPFPFYQNFRISISPYDEVKKIIEEFQPDIVHIQTPLGIGRAALGAAKKFGIPIVATNHSMPENLIDNLKLLAPFARPIRYVMKEYGMWFHNNASYVTLPTQAAIDMFDDVAQYAKVPVRPVSNGIDLSRFKPGKVPSYFHRRIGLPTDKPIIMYAGRLDSEKHLPVLLRAAARVFKKCDGHLLIVGHGNDAERLKNLAEHLGIADRVTFTGRAADEDMPLFYRVANVLAMPSPAELQSIVALEALASGLPIVAVKAGALHELCQEGRNGYMCRVDDDNQMAKLLLKILDDKKLRTRLGRESLLIAKQHDLHATLQQFEAIYEQLIAARVKKTEKVVLV